MRRKSLTTAIVATLATLALATPVPAADDARAASAQVAATTGDVPTRGPSICRPWLVCPPVPA